MAIPIKSPADIHAMRPAARLAWSLLAEAIASCAPGVTTAEIDSRLARQLEEHRAAPILRGLREVPDGPAFPACSCVCVNEEAAHGIPGPRILRPGDIVCIDLSLRLDGWCADAARAVAVRESVTSSPPLPIAHSPMPGDPLALVTAARAAAHAVAVAMLPGARWSTAAARAEEVARVAGFHLAGGLSGHGIGKSLHEPPEAPFGTGLGTAPVQDFILRPGMVLTVEPVLVSPGHGAPTLLGLDDGFTVVTGDRARACHEEIMVAVTRDGPEVLTV